MISKRELELRELAKDYAHAQDGYETARDQAGGHWEMVKEEMVLELARIRMELITKSFSIELFIQYIEEYKSMSIAEYYRIYKGIESK